MSLRLPRRLRLLSLRWRVALAFGLVSLTVAGLLSFVTWQMASSYMLEQRERGAMVQASVDARLVTDNLARGSSELDTLLVGLTGDPEAAVLLRLAGRWTTAGDRIDPEVLPPALLDSAAAGTPARQRLSVGRRPVLAVAMPVGGGGDLFVQLAPLSELDATVRFLSAILIAGTGLSALLGMLLGWWTAKRALRPLDQLTTAAARVAEGDLRARLPQRPEADLAPLAATFNATAEALEERVRRDARFAGDVSHELRSPLTTMINAGEVLRRRRQELPDPARRAVDLLLADVQRLRRMVEDLLEISRGIQVTDGRDREPVDLATAVANIPAALLADAEVDLPAPSPLVQADRRRLDRVLVNLCENAEHHGGGLVRIGVDRREGRAVIEIDDAGPGVPPALREQVFERFARGQRAGDRGNDTGTGLGLALVAQHVRTHGGRVWVGDRPGGGSRFVVELPEAAR